MGESPHVNKRLVSGRELFICDNFVSNETALRIEKLIKMLSYERSERSRPDLPVSGAAAEITSEQFAAEPFFAELCRLGEDMFPQERFELERMYVNSAVSGDVYYAHRDCGANLKNVTALYYANSTWHADWAGETLFFNDQHDAELAITPRPGRLVVSRGAILHRGGVPSPACREQRLTIACKLRALESAPNSDVGP